MKCEMKWNDIMFIYYTIIYYMVIWFIQKYKYMVFWFERRECGKLKWRWVMHEHNTPTGLGVYGLRWLGMWFHYVGEYL